VRRSSENARGNLCRTGEGSGQVGSRVDGKRERKVSLLKLSTATVLEVERKSNRLEKQVLPQS